MAAPRGRLSGPVHHANVENGDRVSIGKKLVLTLADGAVASPAGLCAESRLVVTWTESPTEREIEVACRAYRNLDGRDRLILDPVGGLWPGRGYHVAVTLRDDGRESVFERYFGVLDEDEGGSYAVPMPEPGTPPAPGQYLSARGAREALGFDLEYNLYLPPGYGRRGGLQRYPLVVALHGASSNYTVWGEIGSYLDTAIRNGWLEPMVVAFPDGRIGWGETEPPSECVERRLDRAACQTHFLTTRNASGRKSSNPLCSLLFEDLEDLPIDPPENTRLADFLATSFVPEMRRQHRGRGADPEDAAAARRATGIGGYSLGAHAALLNAFLHPEVYGSVVALSPGGFTAPSWASPEGFGAEGAEESCNAIEAVEPGGERPGSRAAAFRCLATGERLDYEAASLCWPGLAHGDLGDLAFWVDPAKRDRNHYERIRDADFAGNVYLSVPICDGRIGESYYPSSLNAMDLDCLLDAGGIPHTFKLHDYHWPEIHGPDYFSYHLRHGDFFRFFNSVFEEHPQSPDESFEAGHGEVLRRPQDEQTGEGEEVERGDAARHLYFNDPFSHLASQAGLSNEALDRDRDGRAELPAGGDYEAARPYGDNCPEVHNPEQRDDDGDGLGNACDPGPGPEPPWAIGLHVPVLRRNLYDVGFLEAAILRLRRRCGELRRPCLGFDLPFIVIDDPEPGPDGGRVEVFGRRLATDELRFDLGVALTPSLRLGFRRGDRWRSAVFFGGGWLYRRGGGADVPGLGRLRLDSSTRPVLTFGAALGYRLGSRTSFELEARALTTFSEEIGIRTEDGRSGSFTASGGTAAMLSVGLVLDLG